MNYIRTINKYLVMLNNKQKRFILKIIMDMVKAE